jgi:hypothetical protein
VVSGQWSVVSGQWKNHAIRYLVQLISLWDLLVVRFKRKAPVSRG